MDEGTAVAAVTLAEAVVVHTVLLLLLLLVGVSDDGEAPLNCAAWIIKRKRKNTSTQKPQVIDKSNKQPVGTEEDKLCQD